MIHGGFFLCVQFGVFSPFVLLTTPPAHAQAQCVPFEDCESLFAHIESDPFCCDAIVASEGIPSARRDSTASASAAAGTSSISMLADSAAPDGAGGGGTPLPRGAGACLLKGIEMHYARLGLSAPLLVAVVERGLDDGGGSGGGGLGAEVGSNSNLLPPLPRESLSSGNIAAAGTINRARSSGKGLGADIQSGGGSSSDGPASPSAGAQLSPVSAAVGGGGEEVLSLAAVEIVSTATRHPPRLGDTGSSVSTGSFGVVVDGGGASSTVGGGQQLAHKPSLGNIPGGPLTLVRPITMEAVQSIIQIAWTRRNMV